MDFLFSLFREGEMELVFKIKASRISCQCPVFKFISCQREDFISLSSQKQRLEAAEKKKLILEIISEGES